MTTENEIAAVSSNLTFIVPPECQGQMVEYSYACDENTAYQRVTDRSSRTVALYTADWADLPDDAFSSWDPANSEPAISGWESVQK